MEINIVATPSNNYTMQCGIMFYSACVNNPNNTLHFFIITDNKFTEENKKKIENTITPFGNTVKFIIIDDSTSKLFEKFDLHWYVMQVFYRLFMADLLPKEVHKVLYLDCDIIVRHPLDKLWETNLDNFGVAGVHDAQEGTMDHYNRLGYTYDKGYINAGVILANIDYWREHQITAAFADTITNHSDIIKLHDQDVLNYVMQDSKKFVDFTFNMQSGFLFQPKYMQFEYIKYKQEIDDSREDPIILHFSGVRPWTKGSIHPYIDEYFKYKNQTIWKDVPQTSHRRSLSYRIINKFRKPLSKLGLCSVIPNPYNMNLKLKK